MEWFVRAFMKASLTWLALGVTVGVAMAVHPPLAVYRLAHMHMLLLGFVAMMIYGVAFHVMPRFTGNQLHSRRLAGWQWWAANAGLLLMAVGFALRVQLGSRATPVTGLGGVFAAAAAYAFVFNIWRTIDASPRSGAGAGAPGTVVAPIAPRRPEA